MSLELEIRAALQEGGVSFETNGKSFICTCPRCRKPKKLYIRRQDGRFTCWSCRESDNFYGRAEYALSELCNVPVAEIRKKLYGDDSTRPALLHLDLQLGDFMDDDEDFVDIVEPIKTVIMPLDMYDLDHPASAKGVVYLEGRGVPKSIAQEYGILYSPARQRVVFPIRFQGQLYGWQERVIANDQPYFDAAKGKIVKPIKSFTSDDLKKDKVLMFADRLINQKHAILVEGPIDALKCHLAGGNVASLGKGVAMNQIQIIRNSGIHNLYLGLDPDAYLEINSLRAKLRDMTIYDFRPPEPFKDLGAMSMEAVKYHFDNAQILNPGHVLIYLKNLFGVQH